MTPPRALLIIITLLQAIAALVLELIAAVWLLIAMVEHSGLRQPLLVGAASAVLFASALYCMDWSNEKKDTDLL